LLPQGGRGGRGSRGGRGGRGSRGSRGGRGGRGGRESRGSRGSRGGRESRGSREKSITITHYPLPITNHLNKKYTSLFHGLIARCVVKLGLPLNHAGFYIQKSCGDGLGTKKVRYIRYYESRRSRASERISSSLSSS